jgi:hypothetical protein
VAEFCKTESINVMAYFEEVETGKDFDAFDRRPQLLPDVSNKFFIFYGCVKRKILKHQSKRFI